MSFSLVICGKWMRQYVFFVSSNGAKLRILHCKLFLGKSYDI